MKVLFSAGIRVGQGGHLLRAKSRLFSRKRALQKGKERELELILRYWTGIGSIGVNYCFQ